MTFEPDTGLVVNTMRGTVHRPGCDVVTRTNARSGPWLAPWKGVAMKDDDKACGYCKPDLDTDRLRRPEDYVMPENLHADQPPGFPGDGNPWLPPAGEAATRVLAFVSWFGDGQLNEGFEAADDKGPPLYARDLEAVAKIALDVGHHLAEMAYKIRLTHPPMPGRAKALEDAARALLDIEKDAR